MRLLLTSAGITNPSIHDALVELLGKPIAEASALAIPTAMYGNPGSAGHAARFIRGEEPRTPMCELGWGSLGLLELTALTTMDRDLWVPIVEETDALLVAGGNPTYLAYWMEKSGLADLFPSLHNMVYVGFSAGSMVMSPNIGQDFVKWPTPESDDTTLGIVDFAIFPHLDNPMLPDNAMPFAEEWASTMSIPTYAIDDQTAIRVQDGVVDVISEGNWRFFEPA